MKRRRTFPNGHCNYRERVNGNFPVNNSLIIGHSIFQIRPWQMTIRWESNVSLIDLELTLIMRCYLSWHMYLPRVRSYLASTMWMRILISSGNAWSSLLIQSLLHGQRVQNPSPKCLLFQPSLVNNILSNQSTIGLTAQKQSRIETHCSHARVYVNLPVQWSICNTSVYYPRVATV